MEYRTLRELYLNSIAKFGGRPCSSMFDGEGLTYGDFSARAENLGLMLREAGLAPGDKVALLSRNMPNWAVSYFATVISGFVIVPILPDFSSLELAKIITHSEAKGLIVSDKLFSKIPKDTLDTLDIVIRAQTLAILSQRREVSSATVTKNIYEPNENDIAAIIYTSGTTSEPKGVMLTHGNLASQICMEYDLFPIRKSDIFLSILPLSHTYECSVGMLLPFSAGASVVYLDKAPTPATLIPAMQKVRPTIMLSVPLIIEKLFRSRILKPITNNKVKKTLYSWGWFRKLMHRFAGNRLKHIFGGRLRFFGIGGAKLDADTERFLKEANFPYAIGYGLTETAPLIAGALPGKVPFRSTGPVLKGIKARLENVNPQSGEGEIVVLSPSTMKGYFKNPQATKSVFTPDGWFRTKDLGYFDKDGNLYIRGRLDNLILGAGGENIYPEEIESILNSHSLIADSIVKEESGHLVALVRFNRDELEKKYNDLKERMSEIKNDILKYVNSKVSKHSQVSEVEEQKIDFEKTPTLKIKRFKYGKESNKK